jgi:NH3-dependent NAD+ synthetase
LGVSYTHHYKSGLIACGNHTENVLGWFSYADIGSMGVFQPLGDLTKVEIFELAKYLNEEYYNDEVIPKSLYDGTTKPAAELEDSSEDPFDYYLMSHICARIIRYQTPPKQLIADMSISMNFSKYSVDEISKNVYEAFRRSKLSVYKRAQSAPILILSNRSMGFSSREPILNSFDHTTI